MPQDQKRPVVDPEELGRDFEAQSSPSFGGDLGTSFEEHNSSREEFEARRHRGRRRMFLLGGFLLLLVMVAVIFFSTRPKKGAAPAKSAAPAAGGKGGQQGPATITEDKSATGNINVYVNALGTVTPLNTVTIYSQITGKVIAVHYREGQIVSKGQALVDIDPAPYKATLAQAEGTLQHDEGVLAEVRIDLKRYQDAYAQNAIARQQLEDQQQLVVQDEGTVKADEGAVEYDKVQLSYCHIVAPISGRVGLRLVDPGNTVFSGTGSTLVVLTQLQPITVIFNVSEDDLPQVQAQLKAGHVLEVDAYDRSDSKQIATGKLTSLDNQIDTTTGTLKFRATFSNPNNILFPNQFVNARLLVKTLQNVVLVPSAAVQQNGTAAFVYLVKPDPKDAKAATVSVQNISVLTSNEKVNAVTGLPAGATVATSGFDRLESGARVQVQKQSPGTKAQPASNAPPTTGNTSP